MKRRNFLKKSGWLFTGLIFVPTSKAQFEGSFFKENIVAAAAGGNNIAFRNASFSGQATANGATVTEPASAALNDIFVALAFCANASTLAAPTGWTVIYSGTASTLFKYNLSWIRRGASAPSLTWAMNASAYREVYIIAYLGVVTSGNPYEVSADGGVTSGATLNPNAPSVTTITANDVVIASGINWAGAATKWSAPTGYVMRSDITTNGDDGAMADKKVTSPGAEDPAAFSGAPSNSTTAWQATIALKSS